MQRKAADTTRAMAEAKQELLESESQRLQAECQALDVIREKLDSEQAACKQAGEGETVARDMMARLTQPGEPGGAVWRAR